MNNDRPSNESGSLVQKISVENDVVSSAVNTSDNQPKAQDNSWFKRNEFPPAGTVCEVMDGGVWLQTVVVGVDSEGYAVFESTWSDKPYDGENNPLLFRPIKTAEEIAEEEREKAITYMINRFSGLSKVHAVLMYDAGYRLVEAEDE